MLLCSIIILASSCLDSIHTSGFNIRSDFEHLAHHYYFFSLKKWNTNYLLTHQLIDTLAGFLHAAMSGTIGVDDEEDVSTFSRELARFRRSHIVLINAPNPSVQNRRPQANMRNPEEVPQAPLRADQIAALQRSIRNVQYNMRQEIRPRQLKRLQRQYNHLKGKLDQLRMAKGNE